MRFLQAIAILCVTVLSAKAQVDHAVWNELLKKHVKTNGAVSYQGFITDSIRLNAYLDELSANPPKKDWSENERLAYWINAYNALTVKLIIDHYPVASIKDIKTGISFVNSVWDIKFFKIGGEEMDLNEIEHSILRKKFEEPRIHFAIVCASKSCPELRNEAYTAERLEQQLQEQAVSFINDESKNRFSKDEIRISQIFNWFTGDFTKNMTLKEYLKQYAEQPFSSDAKIKYMDYDWSLNGE